MDTGLKSKNNFSRIKRNYDSLKLLSSCSNKIRQSVIKSGSKDLIDSISECILNFLNGNVTLCEQELISLKKYKLPLRKLLKKLNLKEKKKILIQKGGFLSIILPSIITGLASIISSAISKE